MRRFLPSPAMSVAVAALFAALGGTSYAALNSGAAKGCSSASKLKGSALINASATFSSSFKKVSGFNCSGKAIEAERISTGQYVVKFSGNPGTSALGNVVSKAPLLDDVLVSFMRIAPGEFTVYLYNPMTPGVSYGNDDMPFSVVLP